MKFSWHLRKNTLKVIMNYVTEIFFYGHQSDISIKESANVNVEIAYLATNTSKI